MFVYQVEDAIIDYLMDLQIGELDEETRSLVVYDRMDSFVKLLY